MSASFAPVFDPARPIAPEYDLAKLAEKVSLLPPKEQPRVLCCAGRQDEEIYGILSQNRAFAKSLAPLADSRYMEWDGNHEWKFWDRGLVYAVDYFLQNGYAEQKLRDWQCAADIL